MGSELLATTKFPRPPYEHFAHYVTNVYRKATGKGKGELLDVSSATGYTRILPRCLDCGQGAEAVWLRKVMGKMKRVFFIHCMEKGGEMDNSPVSAYVHHVIAIVIQSPPFPFYQVCPRDKFDPFAPSCVCRWNTTPRDGDGGRGRPR